MVVVKFGVNVDENRSVKRTTTTSPPPPPAKEAPRRIVSVPRRSTSPTPPEESEDEKSRAPWFVYQMIQLGGRCKNEANLKVAREPFEDLRRHNNGEVNDKATKPARGAWQIEMIIGPFMTWDKAEAFRKLWMQKSRGPISRRKRGIELVMKQKGLLSILKPEEAEFPESEDLESEAEEEEKEQGRRPRAKISKKADEADDEETEEALGSREEWKRIFCFDRRFIVTELNEWLAQRHMDCLTQSEECLADLYGRHASTRMRFVSCEGALSEWVAAHS